jgi:hypothetical protein
VLKDEIKNPDKRFSKLENLSFFLKLDHQKIINDDTMITQILYNTNTRHYDAMVEFLKLEITMNVSTTLSLEDVKKAYRTIHASIKQNQTRDKRHETEMML